MLQVRAVRSRLTLVLALLAASTFAGCGGGAGARSTEPIPPGAAAGLTDVDAQVARSSYGMVASASRYATEVGARVLAEGGNAVDAAVATAFALAVTEPPMSGLGGRASTLIRTPDGEVYGIDGLNQVPSGYQAAARDSSGQPAAGSLPAGYDRAAIPGVPAALVHALDRYGTWPLSRVMAPAIRLAEDGFVLTAEVATLMADQAETLREYESSRRYFLKPDGSPYRAGERLVQTDLARTLRAIAEDGASAFYRGWIADSIHADMVRAGGFITRDELAGYEALPSIVVRGTYRGHGLIGNYLPASGHTVIEALQIMERFPLVDLPPAERTSITAQAMQLALSDRGRAFGSPERSARRLTSRRWAAERASEISGAKVGGAQPSSGRDAQLQDDPAELVGVGASDSPPWWSGPDQDHTTHLSVVDGSGMAVAHTQSLGPVMGTGLAASGLGFLYATRLGSRPGSRPGSTISPTIVTDPDGRLRYVLGAAGDSRIITAVVQTLSGAIDQGLPIELAVAAPRVHPMGRTGLRVERSMRTGWRDADVEQLRALGFEVDLRPASYFARVHAIAVEGSTLAGAADPRRTGTAVGIRR